jgi:phosphocarrier protein HPr
MSRPDLEPRGAARSVHTRLVEIGNQRGLHARAAARFVKTIDGLEAEVTVVKGDMEVSGRSIMGLMMLAAGPGCVIELRAEGRDAALALDRLGQLIDRKFDEE